MPEVAKFYEEARYDGSRFRVPSFQAVGALWLSLIVRKERELIQEITRVIGTSSVTLNRQDVTALKPVIEAIFAEDRYVERLRIFSEGVARRAASYGIAFDPNVHRVDIPNSAYRAGAANALRRACNNVLAEFELHAHSTASIEPEKIRALSQWLRYIKSHPLKAFVVIFISVILWLASQIDVGDLLQQFR